MGRGDGERPLAIFAGAGISTQPPADLPNWTEFNTALLEALKGLTLRLTGSNPQIEAALEALDIKMISTQAFSDAIVAGFAGADYFPVLDVLDGTRPNANHYALARLASTGDLRVIITTNFDTLIERAFTESDVPLAVCRESADFALAPSPDRCVLYKIHGSAGVHASLVDTVTQKVLGLTPEKRDRLRAVYQTHRLLVVGSSGGDLAFDDDYFAFAVGSAEGPPLQLTWLVNPKWPAGPQLERILAATNGKQVLGTLPAFLEGLSPGSPPPASKAVSSATPIPIETRVLATFEGVAGAPRRAARFCAFLLERVGLALQARPLLEYLEQGDSSQDSPEERAELLLMRAGLDLEANDAQGAMKALLAADQLLESGEGRPADDRRLRLRAAIYKSLAAVTGLIGEHRLSVRAGQRAIDLAFVTENVPQMCESLGNFAHTLPKLPAEEGGGAERALDIMRGIAEVGTRIGDADTICGALLEQATLFLGLGEYDAALGRVNELDARGAWIIDFRIPMLARTLRATVARRRGQPEAALELQRQAVELVDRQPILQAELVLRMLPLFRSEESADKLLEIVTRAQEALLGVDHPMGVEFAARLQKARSASLSGEVSEDWSPVGASPDEVSLRERLMRCESTGDARGALLCLHQLMSKAHFAGRWPRAIDLAKAAAERPTATGDLALTLRSRAWLSFLERGSPEGMRATLEELRRLAEAPDATEDHRDCLASALLAAQCACAVDATGSARADEIAGEISRVARRPTATGEQRAVLAVSLRDADRRCLREQSEQHAAAVTLPPLRELAWADGASEELRTELARALSNHVAATSDAARVPDLLGELRTIALRQEATPEQREALGKALSVAREKAGPDAADMAAAWLEELRRLARDADATEILRTELVTAIAQAHRECVGGSPGDAVPLLDELRGLALGSGSNEEQRTILALALYDGYESALQNDPSSASKWLAELRRLAMRFFATNRQRRLFAEAVLDAYDFAVQNRDRSGGVGPLEELRGLVESPWGNEELRTAICRRLAGAHEAALQIGDLGAANASLDMLRRFARRASSTEEQGTELTRAVSNQHLFTLNFVGDEAGSNALLEELRGLASDGDGISGQRRDWFARSLTLQHVAYCKERNEGQSVALISELRALAAREGASDAVIAQFGQGLADEHQRTLMAAESDAARSILDEIRGLAERFELAKPFLSRAVFNSLVECHGGGPEAAPLLEELRALASRPGAGLDEQSALRQACALVEQAASGAQPSP
jgi:hypothetical protein